MLEATKYEIKARIIEMVPATPFQGMDTENPYRHIRHFTILCNTVRQEGVPDGCFKWNLFPYSLAGEAKTLSCLHPLKLKAIGISSQRNFVRSFFQLEKFNI
jgi:hypothetical protein